MNTHHRPYRLRVFLRGMFEFRQDVTPHYDDLNDADAYDWGREWAHRLTFRYWDN